MDKSLSEELLINLNYEYFEQCQLDETTIANIFKAVAEFQLSLNRKCHRSYPETISNIVQAHMESILYKLLIDIHFEDDSTRQLAASMLSASIYSASENGVKTLVIFLLKLILNVSHLILFLVLYLVKQLKIELKWGF